MSEDFKKQEIYTNTYINTSVRTEYRLKINKETYVPICLCKSDYKVAQKYKGHRGDRKQMKFLLATFPSSDWLR